MPIEVDANDVPATNADRGYMLSSEEEEEEEEEEEGEGEGQEAVSKTSSVCCEFAESLGNSETGGEDEPPRPIADPEASI